MYQNFRYYAQLPNLLLRFSFCIILFFSSFTSYPFYSNTTADALAKPPSTQEEKKIIRIGYQEDIGFFRGKAALEEGYGYEYIKKILSYTTKQYTPVFVKMNWSNAFDMLKNGELDLLPFAAHTDARAKEFLYSKRPLTSEKPVLLPLKSHLTLSADYRELNGKSICVADYSVYSFELEEFLKKYNISATIHDAKAKSIDQLKEDGVYDFLVSYSLLLGYGISYPLEIASMPSHLITSKNNQELMDDIDYALDMIDKKDFLFEKELSTKYFANFVSKKELLTQKEKDSIKNNMFNVGVMVFDSPLCFYRDSGQVAGLFPDIMNLLASIGNFKVQFNPLSRQADVEEINANDFNLLLSAQQYAEPFPVSNAFFSSSYLVIGDTIKTEKTMGVLDYYDLDERILVNALGWQPTEIKKYHTVTELIEAHNENKIDTALLTLVAYNAFHLSFLDNRRVYQIKYGFAPVISFSQNTQKNTITIINKLITQLDERVIADSMTKSIILLNQNSAFYYIKKFWYIYLLGIALVVLFLVFFYKKMKKDKEHAVSYATEYNPVTGLFTFQKFIQETRIFLDTHSKAELRLIMLDIDNFRYIYEMYGFNIGTQVLKQLAHHIKQNLLTNSPVAHYRGDVFCILTPKVSYEYQALVEAFHFDTLNEAMLPILGEHYELSISVGVYDIMDKNLDISYMIDCANIARQKSKTFFGSHIEIFNEQMKEQFTIQTETLTLIKNALKNKEFELFYQPKFDIKHMHVVGAEALIRWFRNGKMIPPDEFIPIAEKHGLINELDYHIIELACQFISTHKKECLPHISINISGFTIIKSELIDKLIEITKKYDVKPQEIDIEITETALINNFDMAINQILALRELGFTISMDDFGTGVSSLNRLSQMPLDTIKLDRVFILDALDNKKSSVIVQTVIDLAKNIGAKTVAEGIETNEQLDLLRSLSCEHGQGYFYARPMSAQDFLKYLDEEVCVE